MPFFNAQLTATDNISGVASTGLILTEPNGTGYSGNTYIEQYNETTSGKFIAGTLLNNPALPTGTWMIAGYQVCDVAGNCQRVTDAATLKQQFGATTFTVTP